MVRVRVAGSARAVAQPLAKVGRRALRSARMAIGRILNIGPSVSRRDGASDLRGDLRGGAGLRWWHDNADLADTECERFWARNCRLLQAFEQPRRRAERELDATLDLRRRRHDWMLLEDVSESASAWVEARDRRRGIAGGGGRRRWVRGRVAVLGASAGPRSWWRGEFLGIREAGREVSVAKAVLCECAASLLHNELQGAHRKIRNFGVRMRTTFTHERSPRRFASRRSRS